jgi:hypothetical protein
MKKALKSSNPRYKEGCLDACPYIGTVSVSPLSCSLLVSLLSNPNSDCILLRLKDICPSSSLSFSLLVLLPPIAFCEPSRYQLRIEDAEQFSSFSFQFCQQYYQNFRSLHFSLLFLNLKFDKSLVDFWENY